MRNRVFSHLDGAEGEVTCHESRVALRGGGERLITCGWGGVGERLITCVWVRKEGRGGVRGE